MVGRPTTVSPSKRRIHPRRKKQQPAAAEPTLPPPAPIHKQPDSAPIERCISRILLRRFEWDIARLYSTHLMRICQNTIPALMMDLVVLTGPGWIAANASKEFMKAYFRGPISMDLRQAGERVATKSVLWSYTAIREFALSRDVEICPHSGVHSHRLVQYLPQLESHLASLEAQAPRFLKPQALGPLGPKFDLLERHCFNRVKRMLTSQNTPGAQYDSYVESITRNKPTNLDESQLPPAWREWRLKLRVGFDMLSETVWEVANEFNATGFGGVLRDKLENKWCDCGCSTDHLGEVCEPALRDDDEEFGHRTRAGKSREWDGRGAGVINWNNEDEEDVWEGKLDFGYDEKRRLEEIKNAKDFVEMRYVKAEREKEQGNKAFKEGHYHEAIEAYTRAYELEPEMAHYQLNIAMAHLKLNNWIETEEACTRSLGLHRSEKGFWRRAKARQMLGKHDEAIADFEEVLKLQPNNLEALKELGVLQPKSPQSFNSINASAATAGSSSQAGGSTTRRKLPFELCDVDFTPLKVVSTKKSWPIPDKTVKETYVYPQWDSYDIQMS